MNMDRQKTIDSEKHAIIAKCIGRCARLAKHRVEKADVASWYEELERFSDDDIQAAFQVYWENAEMPSPNQIRGNIIGRAKERLRQQDAERARKVQRRYESNQGREQVSKNKASVGTIMAVFAKYSTMGIQGAFDDEWIDETAREYAQEVVEASKQCGIEMNYQELYQDKKKSLISERDCRAGRKPWEEENGN